VNGKNKRMKIFFKTKQENKQRQTKQFLALTPYERFKKFLRLSQQMKNLLPVNSSVSQKDNFYISKKKN